MNDELEWGTIPQPHSREVPDIARRETTNAEVFGEHHNRRVDQTEAKVAVFLVNLHGSRELIDRRRRVRKRSTREVVHEGIHR